MVFSEEMEARYDFFAKRLADFLLLYGQLKAQAFHIEQLKWQVVKAVKPANSLSQLLKNVYLNGPGNHFPGATHVLPIIILDSVYRQFDPDADSARSEAYRWLEHRLAFFYGFNDNHIYNFDYVGTFVEELLDNRCILEMC